MQQPSYLKQGSVIGITCPSGYLRADRIDHAVTTLAQWGFNVKIGSTIGPDMGIYFSDSDEARRQDLQNMLDDPQLDAILMGRGGYGLSRIIDALDFSTFLKKPKWICGFSDVTVLHSHIQSRYGIATLHSPMCVGFKPGNEESSHIINFRDALTGAQLSYTTLPYQHNRTGSAEGIITGGNLSLLAHLTGSVSEADTEGKILFIEDTGEQRYNVDRLLLNLKRAGKLDKIAALLVGDFDNIKDIDRPFGQSVEEIIFDKVKEYNYPVCFNFPAGHEDINYTLSFGMRHKLEVNDAGSKLELLH